MTLTSYCNILKKTNKIQWMLLTVPRTLENPRTGERQHNLFLLSYFKQKHKINNLNEFLICSVTSPMMGPSSMGIPGMPGMSMGPMSVPGNGLNVLLLKIKLAFKVGFNFIYLLIITLTIRNFYGTYFCTFISGL